VFYILIRIAVLRRSSLLLSDGVAWSLCLSVCQSVCPSRSCSLQKRTNRSRFHLGCVVGRVHGIVS